jgi:CRP-like cAMP-binding protein
MPRVAGTPLANQLFDALPRRARRVILEQSELVELTFGDILCEPGEQVRDVYFPTGSLISLVAVLDAGASIEVALVGNEGMLGVPLVLGVDISPMRAVVQGTGGAWRMQGTHFRRVLASSPALRRGLDAYVYVLLAQLGQGAACACFHRLEARLAYWLLMTQDRAQGDQFYLTHSLLAKILGVRRSGVSMAAGALQRRRLIRYSRGGITVLDRQGLEHAACACYQVVTAAYSRLSADRKPGRAVQAVGRAAA